MEPCMEASELEEASGQLSPASAAGSEAGNGLNYTCKQPRPHTAVRRRPLSQDEFKAKLHERTAGAVQRFVRSRSVILFDGQQRVEAKKKARMEYQAEQEQAQREKLRSIQEAIMNRPLLMDQDGTEEPRARPRSSRPEAAKPKTPVEIKVENAVATKWFQESDWAKAVESMKERQNSRPKLHEIQYPPKTYTITPSHQRVSPLSPKDQKIQMAMDQAWYKNSDWAKEVEEIEYRQDDRIPMHKLSYPPKSYIMQGEFDAKPLLKESLLTECPPWFQGTQYFKELSGIMERVSNRPEKLHEISYPDRRTPKVEQRNALLEQINKATQAKAEENRKQMAADERERVKALKELCEKGRAQSRLYEMPQSKPRDESADRNILLEKIEAALMEKVKAKKAEMAKSEREQWKYLRKLHESGQAKSPLLALRKSRPTSAF
eukprot:TRINITY_DN52479_c0_g1_i1.p1 TRINITY_DN52479_c0_g1~~TRINITY_DN52479_c0_g1_i1.p1  ORF type:complete len:445 (-),score=100.69 TRINITY_DN52479_c0_g1_i1:33-1334(-)